MHNLMAEASVRPLGVGKSVTVGTWETEMKLRNKYSSLNLKLIVDGIMDFIA